MASKREIMDPSFAVFNLHINKAGEKADREYVRIFGQRSFDRHMKRLREDGIMAIFHSKPNMQRMAWVAMVTVLVNEGNRR